MSKQTQHLEIVKKLLDSKAVDFKAIGDTLAEVGPKLALLEEPLDGDNFCGTGRYFLHLYRIFSSAGAVENLEGLRGAADEMQS
jgi:hypothetical protein